MSSRLKALKFEKKNKKFKDFEKNSIKILDLGKNC